MGCCPFHDDSTASMSVGGVPDRFKCFGCDAGGDVIEFVSQRYQLSFIDSIQALQNGNIGSNAHGSLPAGAPKASENFRASRPTADTTSTAWRGNTSRRP
jgi:DNA primase